MNAEGIRRCVEEKEAVAAARDKEATDAARLEKEVALYERDIERAMESCDDLARHNDELKATLRDCSPDIAYLEQWPALEEENSLSLFRATEALKASTLRLPITSGAWVDAVSLKNAVSSAVDVMQGLGSSVRCMLSKVEDRTILVSELSVVEGQERVMLDECRKLLAIAAKLEAMELYYVVHLVVVVCYRPKKWKTQDVPEYQKTR